MYQLRKMQGNMPAENHCIGGPSVKAAAVLPNGAERSGIPQRCRGAFYKGWDIDSPLEMAVSGICKKTGYKMKQSVK